MRILYIGYGESPFRLDRVSGGQQKVERDMLRLLCQNGNDVTFLTSDDSDIPSWPGLQCYHIGPAKYSEAGKKLKNTRNKIRISGIISVLSKFPEFDLIINHDDPNGMLLRFLTNMSTPCIHFVHSSVHVSGGPGIIGYMQSLGKFADAGHTTVCMSVTACDEWRDQVEKSVKYLESDRQPSDYFVDYFHPGVMWKIPELVAAGPEFITVGRPDKFKRHHVAFQATQNLTLYAQSPKNQAEEEYWQLLNDKYKAVVWWDQPYDFIMSKIAEAQALLVCGPESFGLTAFEALQHGTPVVVISKRPHAVEEMCKYGIQRYKDVDEARKALTSTVWQPYGDQERLEIQTEMWKKYNPAQVYCRFMNLVDSAITKFNSRESTGLEAIF